MSVNQMVGPLLLLLAEGRLFAMTSNGTPYLLYGCSANRRDWLNEVSSSHSVSEPLHESGCWAPLEQEIDAAFLSCNGPAKSLGLLG